MLKMYRAEVLAKFPVVQHFPFGGILRWEPDPTTASTIPSVHTESQPRHGFSTAAVVGKSSSTSASSISDGPTKAPWASTPTNLATATVKANEMSRARGAAPSIPPTAAMVGAVRQTVPTITLSGRLPAGGPGVPRGGVDTVAPGSTSHTESVPWLRQPEGSPAPGMPMTAAPWAKPKPNSNKDEGKGTGS
jgi:Phosphotyrosyl phosphate activator (PTPA) protein